MFCIEYDYCRKCCCRAGAEFAVRRLKVGLGEVAGRRRMRKRRGGGRAGVVYLPRSSVRSLARSKGAVEAAIVSSFALPYAARRKPKSGEKSNSPLEGLKSGLGGGGRLANPCCACRSRGCVASALGRRWVRSESRISNLEVEVGGELRARDIVVGPREVSRRSPLGSPLQRGWQRSADPQNRGEKMKEAR